MSPRSLSSIIHLPSYIIHHTSYITHHPSPITHHPSPITNHPSPITPSPITPSHITHHTSPITHHTITHYTSHHHTSHITLQALPRPEGVPRAQQRLARALLRQRGQGPVHADRLRRHQLAVGVQYPEPAGRPKYRDMLSLCFRSASALLPLCFRSAFALLLLCFRSASALLPLCFRSNLNAIQLFITTLAHRSARPRPRSGASPCCTRTEACTWTTTPTSPRRSATWCSRRTNSSLDRCACCEGL
jgi:hypothetical protein